jgi:hypothetical protein
MDTHFDEINEIKLLDRKNRKMKHIIAKQKIDQTGDIEDGKILLKKLDNAEDKSLSGSGHMNESLIRKIGSGRKKLTIKTINLNETSSNSPTKSTRPKTDWQILVNKTMKEQGLGLKDTLKYIKEKNLYKKK